MEQCSETLAYKIQTPGIHFKKKETFTTRRKFEIKNKRSLVAVFV